MRRIASITALLTGAAVLTLMPGTVLASSRSTPQVCSGSPSKPGVLSGTYASGVVVTGFCEVNNGPAQVVGQLTLNNNSVLLAAFGMKNSKLSVRGNVTVGQGATLILGCNTTSFPCFDDPNQSAPTLHSSGYVTGNVTENAPLGVIIHSTVVGGNITETGGGGGVSCTPTGPFAAFGSPVFSDYEDNSIGGTIAITGVNSCWLGVIRNHVGRTLRVANNSMADPDAIEIETNVVTWNLACWGNKQHVWDSAETSPTGALYPRQTSRNTVGHYRLGQCLTAGPVTQGGPPVGGPF
jgi:hypothetical protein